MSFQGPKAGPGPRPVEAYFIHVTLLRYVGKFCQKQFGHTLTKILGPPLIGDFVWKHIRILSPLFVCIWH